MQHKKGLVEWLKVKALSSNSSTIKKKKRGGLGCSSAVECLPSIHKTQGPIPSTAREREKEEEKEKEGEEEKGMFA
jgi:hypothetical protein